MALQIRKQKMTKRMKPFITCYHSPRLKPSVISLSRFTSLFKTNANHNHNRNEFIHDSNFALIMGIMFCLFGLIGVTGQDIGSSSILNSPTITSSHNSHKEGRIILDEGILIEEELWQLQPAAAAAKAAVMASLDNEEEDEEDSAEEERLPNNKEMQQKQQEKLQYINSKQNAQLTNYSNHNRRMNSNNEIAVELHNFSVDKEKDDELKDNNNNNTSENSSNTKLNLILENQVAFVPNSSSNNDLDNNNLLQSNKNRISSQNGLIKNDFERNISISINISNIEEENEEIQKRELIKSKTNINSTKEENNESSSYKSVNSSVDVDSIRTNSNNKSNSNSKSNNNNNSNSLHNVEINDLMIKSPSLNKSMNSSVNVNPNHLNRALIRTSATTLLPPLSSEWMSSLLLSTSSSPATSPKRRPKRSVVHLYDMVVCSTGCNPLAYKGYGCYCGFLGSGLIVDGIDKCCAKHDWCYHHAKCPPLMTYFVPYYWTCNEGRPKCVTDYRGWKGICGAHLCECDRQFAECLRKYPCPRGRAVCLSSPIRNAVVSPVPVNPVVSNNYVLGHGYDQYDDNELDEPEIVHYFYAS